MREGRDLAILAIGQTVWPAMEAAERLSERNVEAMVANMRFVKPFDARVAEMAAKTGFVLAAEDNSLIGGLYGAVCEQICALKTDKPIRVKGLGLGDAPVLHANQSQQRTLMNLDSAGIFKAALELLQ
ncbi:MAG: hypothetical protein LBJ64_02475 [Deltaproteobacteria bacterium]|nr:hypothetical protein [Deltaproteobacteria bacterium]